MNRPTENPWTPTPELLAAYADGELCNRPELAGLRSRIEEWLGSHPEAVLELEAQRELLDLVAATKPRDPGPAAWAAVLSRIEHRPPRQRKSWPAATLVAGLMAAGVAAAVILVALNQSADPPRQEEGFALPGPPGAPGRQQLDARGERARDGAPALAVQALLMEPERSILASDRRPEAVEVFEVATSEDVEIYRVAGASIGTLVVGQLPLTGPIVLLQAHEVELKSPVTGSPGAEFHIGGGGAPMIWTLPPKRNDKDH